MPANQVNPLNRTEFLQIIINPNTGQLGKVSVIDIPELGYVSEGVNNGWRLRERDTLNHGDIGNGGIDFSRGTAPSSLFGSTGTDSFSWGVNNESSGNKSTTFGIGCVSSNYGTTSFGSYNQASASLSTSWGELNVSSGEISTTWGTGNTSNSFAATVLGTFATVAAGQTTDSIVATDEIFKIGVGTSAVSRADGLCILKDGTITAPSLTEAKINAAGNSAITTREYVNNIVASSVTLAGDYDAATNTPDLDVSPSGILTGYHYVVSVAGVFFTANVEVGDSLIAKQDNPTLETHWIIAQTNLDAASIKTLYESNSDTNAYSDADLNTVGFITVTQAVDLDDIEQNQNDLITLSGVSENSTDLGTFLGSTISDNVTNKVALQELESAVEGIGLGTTNLGYTPSPTDGTVTSDTGTDATLTTANGTNAGLLLPADYTKLTHISVTQAVDLDTIESDTATNNSKLTADETNVVAALDGATLSSATVAGTDKVLVQDVDDLDNLKTVTAQSIADLVVGLTDGDKGDITVSGGGATWTIDNDAVTFAKIQNINTDVLIGRDTAASGDSEEISVSGGIEFTGAGAIQTSAFTGDVTKSAGGTATTIANDAVTYAKIQNVVADNVILGNNAGAGGIVDELTATEVRTIINVEAGADVTDETNVTDALDGATLTAATIATADKVLIQDTDDSDILKTVTTQAVADLKVSQLSEDTTPQLGGILDTNSQQVRWSKGSDVASGAALTLGTDGNYFDITGNTSITSIATLAVGTVVKLHFDAALTLTHHATDLILPGGASITTAAGDEAELIEYATGDWRCTNYTKANGEAVVSGGGVDESLVFSYQLIF
jgi:hypothetical protein